MIIILFSYITEPDEISLSKQIPDISSGFHSLWYFESDRDVLVTGVGPSRGELSSPYFRVVAGADACFELDTSRVQ